MLRTFLVSCSGAAQNRVVTVMSHLGECYTKPCLGCPVFPGNRGDRNQEHHAAECSLSRSSQIEERTIYLHHH
jgi:hypothetical protein